MTDWMDDFKEQRKNDGQKTSKVGACKKCDKVTKLGDDGTCAACDLRSVK